MIINISETFLDGVGTICYTLSHNFIGLSEILAHWNEVIGEGLAWRNHMTVGHIGMSETGSL
jgi:hypothetical protein